MNILDPHYIVTTLGMVGILTILFVETGLLIGLVFPGDSLLFIAGVAASATAMETFGIQLPISILLLAAPLFAILGSQLGHLLGATYGRKLFSRPDSRIFSQAKVQRTEKWLSKYGLGKALILARFIPVVRTLINPLCGIVGIPAAKFAIWNLISGIIWTDGIILAGFTLGEKLSGSVDKYLLPIVGVIIVLSLIPVAIEFIKEWQTRKHLT
jgi:membrane-associated protein